ncbi:hypothetical protein HDU82_003241 [Entophlyctis luteolus]|nr:hypothetical protein HDU82_003241 [Entophlyctis luteolus]
MHCDSDVCAAALAIVALSCGHVDAARGGFAAPPPPPPVPVRKLSPGLKAEPEPEPAPALSAAASHAPDHPATSAGPRVVACDACRRSRKKCVFPTRRPPPVPDSSDGKYRTRDGCLSCVRRGVLCSAVPTRRKGRSRPSAVHPVKPSPSPTNAAAPDDDASPPFTSAHPHRIPVSCKLCYSKKMRCDRRRPGCSACAKRGAQCSYWSDQQQPSSPSPPVSSPANTPGDSDSPSSSIFSVKVAPSNISVFSSPTATQIQSTASSSEQFNDSTLYSKPPLMVETLESVADGFWC